MSDPLLAAEAHAREKLEGRSCGHDFFHADRVRRSALQLAETEGGNTQVVELAALLHDVADPKLNDDPAKAERELEAFLRGLDLSADVVDHVLRILAGMSFGRELSGVEAEKSVEFRVVQDADRLDALGAIGIARCFAYGGSVNQALFDPALTEREQMTAKEYRHGKSSSLNHFGEKLLRLRDRMNTATARRWAESRHAFLREFRERFLTEWDGLDFPSDSGIQASGNPSQAGF
ncbi:MAG TPA: HD domain-containing protein [Fibrobacteria bacterium]|jgi:uncharacterized protein|nr:HD domain-containing protein [Fibrobacteria bacterium]